MLVQTKREMALIVFTAVPESVISTVIVNFKNLKFSALAVGPLVELFRNYLSVKNCIS